MANIDADGQVAYTPITGPFGEKIPSLNGAQQINTTHLGPAGSSSYLGSYRKTTDSGFATSPTQMGARVYIAELGRFLQVDPVGQNDISGKAGPLAGAIWAIVKATVNVVVRVVIPGLLGFGPIRGNFRAPNLNINPRLWRSRLPAPNGSITLPKIPAYNISPQVQKRLGQIQKGIGDQPGYRKSHEYKNLSFPRLPEGGKYRTYDVNPKSQFTPGQNTGRITVDEKTGRSWYSQHYGDYGEDFIEIY